MIPSLGNVFIDKMADFRRSLVNLIQENNEIDIFPRAFDRNGKPRPLNGRYDTIYIETLDLDGNISDGDIEKWIRVELKNIKEKKLETLERLMKSSGLK